MTDLPENISIQKLDGKRDLSEVRELRRKIFIEEQKVPEGIEWDGLDSFYTHYLIKEGGKPIGTARAKTNPMGDGKLGRLCLLPEARNKKLGRVLLDFIIADLKKNDKNLKNIKISAQTSVVPFYEKAGFTKFGDEYMEADMPHYAMSWEP
jgi:predicted GNAT family N-acyltransferase